MEEERVQKFIALSGLTSRRKSEDLIKQNKVKVNGKIIKLGDKCLATDKIEVNNKQIYFNTNPGSHTYIILNKKAGFVCSKEDKFKIGLFLPFKFMGYLYFINKDFARCVKVFKIIFNLVLEVTSEYAVLIAYLIEICYFRLGNMQKVGKYCKIMLDYDFYKNEEFLLERVKRAGFNF